MSLPELTLEQLVEKMKTAIDGIKDYDCVTE